MSVYSFLSCPVAKYCFNVLFWSIKSRIYRIVSSSYFPLRQCYWLKHFEGAARLDRFIPFMSGWHEDICGQWLDLTLWFKGVKQVSKKKKKTSLSWCNHLFPSVWSHYVHGRAHSNLADGRCRCQQSVLLNSWKPQGFPRLGVASPPLTVNTSIIPQVDWLAQWRRH